MADVHGGGVGEFFDALGPRWLLTGRQRARLVPAVTAALEAGWAPQRLAACTGGNTRGVRSAFAVLAAGAPGLYVLGLPVLRTRASTYIHGAAADTETLAGHLHAFLSSQHH